MFYIHDLSRNTTYWLSRVRWPWPPANWTSLKNLVTLKWQEVRGDSGSWRSRKHQESVSPPKQQRHCFGTLEPIEDLQLQGEGSDGTLCNFSQCVLLAQKQPSSPSPSSWQAASMCSWSSLHMACRGLGQHKGPSSPNIKDLIVCSDHWLLFLITEVQTEVGSQYFLHLTPIVASPAPSGWSDFHRI